MRKSYLLAALAAILILVLLVLPVRFSRTVHAPGKVLPLRQWLLQRSPDGNLTAMLYDHAQGMVSNYLVMQNERGDAGKFVADPAVRPNGHVDSGDTLGIFYSNENERQLLALEGELQSARALLAATAAGEKETTVEAARQFLEMAAQRSREQQRLLERQKSLYDQSLVSLQELETVQTAARVAALQERIARAELENAASGAKPLEIKYLRTRVEGLQREIAVLEKRQQQFTLLSPLTGMAMPTFSLDTLMLIADTTQLVALFPVRLSERPLIDRGQAVDIAVKGSANTLSGNIVRIDRQARRINGEDRIFVAALLAAPPPTLPYNATVQGTIHCAGATLFEYLRQSTRTITIN